MINHYIRGGQIFLHKIRMFAQVWYNNLLFATLLSLIISTYLYYPKLLSIDHLANLSLTKAFIVRKIDDSLQKSEPTKISAYTSYGQYSRNMDASKIATHPFFQKKFKHTINILSAFIKTIIIIGIATSILIIIIWYSFGKISNKTNIISGNKILSANEASKILTQKKIASNMRIGNMPLVKSAETSHILFAGTTGTGKTTSMNILLKQIRAQNQTAIIIDYNGQMSDKFFRDGDIIIGNGEYS